ncbi:Phage protein D [Bordetella ansorpii]|uniref:Phage protein D n=1 Tax=Bordetella ansorpii TaxID=288768 RepID=A0A157QPM0_9BORD|nr:contractile injection system protein, VgrG/Pvc8 family [Bordetella ansorpii]SAI47548.1 Phage protein D [Bordetella ansorpii]
MAFDALTAYPEPLWSVTLDGRDITGRIAPRLMHLTLTECRSDQADQLDIEVSDHDGAVAIPARGVVIRVRLGWSGAGMVDKGAFTVDEVEYTTAPTRITIRARSADLKSALRVRNERSFHGKTIGDIVASVAADHGLQAVVGENIKAMKVPHIDQTNESDAAFLNRIGKRYDTVATVKDGRLLFVPIARGETASGQATPTTTLRLIDGDRVRFHVADRDAYTGVSAFWQDKRAGQNRRQRVLFGVIGNAKRLRTLYGSEADALAAAQAEWERIQRGVATFEMELARGRPDLSVQGKLHVPELKAPLGGYVWLMKQLTHRLDDSGLTTRIEGETAEAAELRDSDSEGETP